MSGLDAAQPPAGAGSERLPASRQSALYPSYVSRLLIGIAGSAAFYLVYGGADYIVRNHPVVAPIIIPNEPAWPFVEDLSLVYLSTLIALSALPFVLETWSELRYAALLLGGQLIGAAPFFVLLPFASIPGHDSQVSNVYELLDLLNLSSNYFPSLHVSFSFSCAYLLGARKTAAVRLFFWVWAALVSIATLLLHQHYLIDVVGGIALFCGAAWICNGLGAPGGVERAKPAV